MTRPTYRQLWQLLKKHRKLTVTVSTDGLRTFKKAIIKQKHEFEPNEVWRYAYRLYFKITETYMRNGQELVKLTVELKKLHSSLVASDLN